MSSCVRQWSLWLTPCTVRFLGDQVALLIFTREAKPDNNWLVCTQRYVVEGSLISLLLQAWRPFLQVIRTPSCKKFYKQYTPCKPHNRLLSR